jgi:hypothetical protein
MAATQPRSQPVALATPAAPATPPRSGPPVAARPVVVETVVPEPNDIYISVAANSDIVFVGGNTYIWAVGPDGQRHRHFYGHGDRRQEVFRRRENLRSVAGPRSGHPPGHPLGHPPAHPPVHYAALDHGHHADDAHRAHQLPVKSANGHGPIPQHHLMANNQAHQTVAHGKGVPAQNQAFRAASTGNSTMHRKPEPRISAMKSDAPSRS